MTCSKPACIETRRERDQLRALVVELYAQVNLRDQLRTGKFDSEPMPALMMLTGATIQPAGEQQASDRKRAA